MHSLSQCVCVWFHVVQADTKTRFLQQNMQLPVKVKLFLRVIASPSSFGVYFPIQVTVLIFSQSIFYIKLTIYQIVFLFSIYFIRHLDSNIRACNSPRILGISKIFLVFICNIPTYVLWFPGETNF